MDFCDIDNILIEEDQLQTVWLYFSTKSAGDDYDSYEANYTLTNLNPIPVKGYVHQVTAKTAFYKLYGQHVGEAIEFVCDKRFKNPFETCSKVVYNGEEYQVFRQTTGSRVTISDRPSGKIRVTMTRNG